MAGGGGGVIREASGGATQGVSRRPCRWRLKLPRDCDSCRFPFCRAKIRTKWHSVSSTPTRFEFWRQMRPVGTGPFGGHRPLCDAEPRESQSCRPGSARGEIAVPRREFHPRGETEQSGNSAKTGGIRSLGGRFAGGSRNGRDFRPHRPSGRRTEIGGSSVGGGVGDHAVAASVADFGPISGTRSGEERAFLCQRRTCV